MWRFLRFMRRQFLWIVCMVAYHLCAWGSLLVAIRESFSSGTLWLSVLEVDCLVGKAKIFRWGVGWFSLSLYCPPFRFIFFPYSKLPHSLDVRYARLFDLAVNICATVAEMFSLYWEVNGEAWKWNWRLFAWEEGLVRECAVQLSLVVLQVGVSDRWIWKLHSWGILRGGFQNIILFAEEIPLKRILIKSLITNQTET